MGLVHDDATVGVKVVIAQGLPQKNTVSHVLYDCFTTSTVLESNCVTDLLRQIDVLRDKKRKKTARGGLSNHSTLLSKTRAQPICPTLRYVLLPNLDLP
mmetsp:Transcript_20255/g.81508  ORF Transcript_20255/g.81508 Transcript_20255/m.81508 type:complete len:99 (+) Transcript_20255:1856-2152(+)